jgi:hypothetical protein
MSYCLSIDHSQFIYPKNTNFLIILNCRHEICIFFIILQNMDKRSFNLLFTLVVTSMVVIGTYKLSKKKSHKLVAQTTVSKKNK